MLPRLCMNHNSFTTPVVRDWITADMIMAVLGPECQYMDLPDHIRSKFYDIVTHGYIDTKAIYQSFSRSCGATQGSGVGEAQYLHPLFLAPLGTGIMDGAPLGCNRQRLGVQPTVTRRG